jgi:hypothetical protein
VSRVEVIDGVADAVPDQVAWRRKRKDGILRSQTATGLNRTPLAGNLTPLHCLLCNQRYPLPGGQRLAKRRVQEFLSSTTGMSCEMLTSPAVKTPHRGSITRLIRPKRRVGPVWSHPSTFVYVHRYSD